MNGSADVTATSVFEALVDYYASAILHESSADLERCAGLFRFAGGDEYGDLEVSGMPMG